MADYTNMSDYYDMIMTSGYYDYDSIVDNIPIREGQSIFELGCGTGLILEKLANKIPCKIAGMDVTKPMLDIAIKRLKDFPDIRLYHQDILTLSLDEQYDMAFSYGGIWYFSAKNDELSMISHISDHPDNEKGIDRLSRHIRSGGKFLLGILRTPLRL
uniref:Methyltransferase domain-containing protein n=1 Tax=Candidatus Kentrum sp. LPFa TaxID=2126335 RepID=A0A450VPT1_9GAMM|nr:MAG: Methyltransferase domain-containing protein [Candidatus Kentron sp. LPFa]VFK33220.1 MAG: Methyltransferase domain-containing protein [Candidatus Kentron sp. LPFa]